MEIVAVDLFCGVGGLTYGMQRGGVRVRCGVDIDASCKYPYEVNNKSDFVNKDIFDLSPKHLKKMFGNVDYRVLVGCAPCQPFSPYSHGLNRKRNAQWKAIEPFADLISDVLPDVISMENVVELASQPIYTRFVNSLKRSGYEVTEHRVRCLSYGIPQERRRLVLLASLHGEITLRDPNAKSRNVRDTIGNLPVLQAGESDKADPLHCAQSLSPLNRRRIQSSKPGGTWHDWDKELIAKCHLKKKGSSFRSVYGRMAWDDPSPTITTQFYKFGSGRFGHPTQDRALSLREGAMLQTFPRHYKFVEPKSRVSFQALGKLIGNAVPVRLGEIIAKSIRDHLVATA